MVRQMPVMVPSHKSEPLRDVKEIEVKARYEQLWITSYTAVSFGTAYRSDVSESRSADDRHSSGKNRNEGSLPDHDWRLGHLPFPHSTPEDPDPGSGPSRPLPAIFTSSRG